MFKNSILKSEKGQGVLELAMMAPLLILFVFISMDMAQLCNGYIIMINASREGAKTAWQGNPNNIVEQRVTGYINGANKGGDLNGNGILELSQGEIPNPQNLSSCNPPSAGDFFDANLKPRFFTQINTVSLKNGVTLASGKEVVVSNEFKLENLRPAMVLISNALKTCFPYNPNNKYYSDDKAFNIRLSASTIIKA